ncbi:uncharacterized protein N7482_005077 [Penicillium canariense]|uniref:Uncharacterized protein n=1 Tax=Penicillium canariense TaxID=189055 RepID=A0A9W9I1U5_9EURO|nr:uncharacterized protein N7482_005077 [Penicillium canariense]KAJ5166296.1 hypothetical protein N7482_005077 [Penicillium canariense]
MMAISGRGTTRGALAPIIQLQGLQIPILEVEAVIMGMPYVAEAIIVSVDDADAAKNAAALVRFEIYPPFETESISTLHRMRADIMSKGMEAYKLPNMLHILQDDEDVPGPLRVRSSGEKPLLSTFLSWAIQRFLSKWRFVA